MNTLIIDVSDSDEYAHALPTGVRETRMYDSAIGLSDCQCLTCVLPDVPTHAERQADHIHVLTRLVVSFE